MNFGRHILKEITEGPGHPHIELAVVCDLDEKLAHTLGQQYHVPFYTKLEELLGNSPIHAIGLYTGPAHLSISGAFAGSETN